MSRFRIVSGPLPGVAERIVAMHDSYYGAHWGFGPAFTRKNAAELADLLGRFDPDHDGLWTAQVNGRVEGSVVVDGSHAGAEGAHLRWFLVGDALRGCGAGSQLLRDALAFCRGCGFDSIYLWTFAGLDAARRLYEASGFVLTEEHSGMRWGTEVMEQRMECDLRHTP